MVSGKMVLMADFLAAAESRGRKLVLYNCDAQPKINMEIKIARSDEDILKCWNVLFELRPHLDKNSFLPTVKEMLTEGYQLAFIEINNEAVAAIGFRYQQYLYNGKHFYIDDISTMPLYRGKGYAGKLIDHVTAKAKEKGFKSVTLDSGYQRFDAHRLYLNKGFTLHCHHFFKMI